MEMTMKKTKREKKLESWMSRLSNAKLNNIANRSQNYRLQGMALDELELRQRPGLEREVLMHPITHCHDPRHDTPCPLPCEACEAECIPPARSALKAG